MPALHMKVIDLESISLRDRPQLGDSTNDTE